jgi:predicted nucleic acid-binding protein
LKSRVPSNHTLIAFLSVELHQGEAEAIALALEMKASHLLIDEREGRAMARQLGLPLTGILGVLLRAKKTKQIAAVKPEIEALKTKARFFIAPALETAVLAQAGE